MFLMLLKATTKARNTKEANVCSCLRVFVVAFVREFLRTLGSNVAFFTSSKVMTLGIVYHMPFWRASDGTLRELEGSFARYVDSLAPYFDEISLCVPVLRNPSGEGTRDSIAQRHAGAVARTSTAPCSSIRASRACCPG